jgi:hypothetical protein
VKSNPCLQAALDELEAAGIRGVEIVRGGKHLQLRWRVNGQGLRVFAVPGSPSDWRSPKNARSDIRRILRSDGILTAPEPKPAQQSTAKVDRMGDLERRVAALERALELQTERGAAALTREEPHQ